MYTIPTSSVSIDAILDREYFICPARTLSAWEKSMLFFYRHYKNGFLPASGGLLAQSRTYLEAMHVIDGQADEIMEERRRKVNNSPRRGKKPVKKRKRKK